MADNVHAPAIQWAALRGITCGYPDGTYRPADHVRRDQLAALLARTLTAAGHTLPAPTTRHPRPDRHPAHPHPCLGRRPRPTRRRRALPRHRRQRPARAIDAAYELGLTHGTTPTTFSPHAPVRRDQTATFLIRLYQLL